MDYLIFIVSFFKDWRRTGSLVPSSWFLAKRLVRPVDFAKAKVIVELGAGTGAITRMILKKMRPDARLYVFETNTEFCARLKRIKDGRLVIINDSATEIDKYLSGERAHHVVSSLPIANFSPELTGLILESIYQNLEKGGGFTQFQYATGSYDKVRHFFKDIKIGFTLLNIPPAFIYECVKP
jgi:phospholipid N-methyltransferase